MQRPLARVAMPARRPWSGALALWRETHRALDAAIVALERYEAHVAREGERERRADAQRRCGDRDRNLRASLPVGLADLSDRSTSPFVGATSRSLEPRTTRYCRPH